MIRLHTRQILVCLTTVAVAACSGDVPDLSDGVQGLSAPEGVNLVDPDTSNVSTGDSGFPNAGSLFPAGSAYVTDAASVRLYDNSLEAIQTANNILCEVGLTRFYEFANKPTFIAQVDPALCGNGPTQNESEGQAVNLHMFTMDVDRATNSDPQTASLWLPLLENNTLINGSIVVTSGPTANDRYGEFSLTYVGIPDGGTIANPAMFGVIASDAGENGFRFIEGQGDVDVPAANPGDRAELVQVAVERNNNGTGSALVRRTSRSNDGSGDSGKIITDWRVVFDQTHVKKQLGADPEIVLSRTSFIDNVYSYNLYHNQGNDLGDRVELSSGTSVEFINGAYGWVGYFGAWAEPGVTFTDGAQVTAKDGTPYSVVAAPGRLMKYTSATLLLTEIGTQRFEWWEANRYQVDYSGGNWRRVAQWNDMNEEWDEIALPTIINVAGAGGFLGMWSQFLGPVTYVDGDLSISYSESELVTGSSDLFTGATNGDVTLYATFNGLKGEIDQTEADNGDIYLATPVNIANAHKFVINEDTMTLMHDVNGDGSVMEQVGLDTGIIPASGPNMWGMQSGRMVLQTAWAGMSNLDDLFSETEFYVYETGHNPWNQLVALQQSNGAYLEFDEPVEFLYTHATGNDINGDATYNGQQIRMSYGGPGRLWGIPGSEQDVDGDGNTDQWFPDFSLMDGTTMGPNGNDYVLRAIGVDQALTPDPGAGATLNLADADALTLPPLSLYVVPDIGPQPTVTGGPSVIDGVIQ